MDNESRYGTLTDDEELLLAVAAICIEQQRYSAHCANNKNARNSRPTNWAVKLSDANKFENNLISISNELMCSREQKKGQSFTSSILFSMVGRGDVMAHPCRRPTKHPLSLIFGLNAPHAIASWL